MIRPVAIPTPGRVGFFRRPNAGAFVMAVLIIAFGFYIVYPVILIFVHSFNVGSLREPFRFGLDHWRAAFAQPGIVQSLLNTVLIYFAYTAIAFPVAVLIAWTLARTRIPFSSRLELMFWVSFMLPALSTTIGWTLLLDPNFGFINVVLKALPLVQESPFSIYSVPGIIFAHLMAHSISQQVMLLTPAFRNMDSSLEEASRVAGGSTLGTMLRVTLPVMVPPMVLVLMLNSVTPIRFYVYSTKIFDLVRHQEPPGYGQATALASLTLLIIAAIIPLQRWLLSRRHYTTVTSQFRPGLIDLGPVVQRLAFILIAGLAALLTIVPICTLLLGSFMTRAGFFQANPTFTLRHWQNVLGDSIFLNALQTTFVLSMTTAIISPVLFSIVAYIILRTRWPGRGLLDSMFWLSASIPGILSGLGLLWVFLGTPGLIEVYGTIWALLLVSLLQGKLTSTQLMKATFLQLGQELEDAFTSC